MTSKRNINRPIDTDPGFDQLLALAEPVPPSPQLGESILETARSVPADLPPASPYLKAEILAATAKLHPFPLRGGRPGWGSGQFPHPPRTLEDPHPNPPPLKGRELWAAGSLMAASVVLGLWLGNIGIADTYLRPTLSVVGLAQPDDDQLFTSEDYLGVTDTTGEVL